MLKNIATFALIVGTLFPALQSLAQAGPTATALSNLQIGGGYTYARTDYGQKGDKGFTVYGDYDIGLHWGAEAVYHYASVSTPNGISENSFGIGPRVILRSHHFKPYGKVMIGLGHITSSNPLIRPALNETDFVFSGGGGLEYLIGSHLSLRPIDVEYQRWSLKNGLNPVTFTTGVAYRFH